MTCKNPPYTRTRSRAFTLVELMAVVSIVAILAVLAIVGYKKYMNSARSSEAINVIGAIKAAQEAYRAETLQYLNVSGGIESWYPYQNPTNKKMNWGNPGGNDAANWARLNVAVDGPVYFGYACVAGGPGNQLPAIKDWQWPVPIEPWYVVQARGDVDGDGVYATAVGTSFSAEIAVRNEGE